MSEIKCKNMMYVQQVSYLPANISSLDDLVDIVVKVIQPKKYAIILHDKDTTEDGKPKAEHIHLMLSFENARYISQIAKLLNDEPERIQKWSGKSDYGYAYLCHIKKDYDDDDGQFEYDYEEVVASFDYPRFAKKFKQYLADLASQKKLRKQLDGVLDGKLDIEDVINSLSAWDYSRYKKQIKDTIDRRSQIKVTEWQKQMVENNTQITVIWLYGPAAAGKTSFAKAIAESKGKRVFISGSSRDLFERYQNEEIVILDDLRPSSFPYNDLLRILDPYNYSAIAGSRYHDKSLMVSCYIITTPFSPVEFYNECFGITNDEYSTKERKDSFRQLQRRISTAICMYEKRMIHTCYNGREYVDSGAPHIYNPYSNLARNNTINISDGKDIFVNMIVDLNLSQITNTGEIIPPPTPISYQTPTAPPQVPVAPPVIPRVPTPANPPKTLPTPSQQPTETPTVPIAPPAQSQIDNKQHNDLANIHPLNKTVVPDHFKNGINYKANRHYPPSED